MKFPTFLEAAGRTFGPEEEALLLEVLRSGCLTRHGGTMVKRLEAEFASRLGVGHAVACSSGTAAVHLAVAALDPEPGDEFIVPPVTDMGTVAPVLWQNAIPVFADLDPVTLTLDPEDVERQVTPRTRAIIAVHLAGQPCDLTALRHIARRHGLVLIEDCSQAYWAEYDGRLVGTFGELACFSLQQSKHMTCGEGGLMVTSNPDYARRASLFADKAWPRDTGGLGAFRFLFLAQNYRMTELQGAVALGQLGKVAATVERRRRLADQLTARIAGLPAVQPPSGPPNTRSSYWLYMLRIADPDRLGAALKDAGATCWVRYIIDPLYLSPIFTEPHTFGRSGYPLRPFGRQRYVHGLCPQAERALSQVIALQWNENYTAGHIDCLAAAIASAVRGGS